LVIQNDGDDDELIGVDLIQGNNHAI
jgi:hypothetical protein